MQNKQKFHSFHSFVLQIFFIIIIVISTFEQVICFPTHRMICPCTDSLLDNNDFRVEIEMFFFCHVVGVTYDKGGRNLCLMKVNKNKWRILMYFL